MPTIRTLTSLLLLAGATIAQAPAERLSALLRELTHLDATAWSTRATALEQRAATAEARAAQLRRDAAALHEQAAAAEQEAQRLRAQILELQQLQARLASLRTLLDDAPSAAARPAAPPAAAPKTTDPSPPAAAATPPMAPAPPPDAAPRASVADATAERADEVVLFARDIAPLLEQHCVACHDPDEPKGGFDASSLATIRQGGSSGRTLVPGDPDQSRLWQLVARQERPFMPKDDDALPAAAVQLLRRWIEQGAPADAAEARAFQRRRQAAATTPAPAAIGDDAGPMPTAVPALPLAAPPQPAPVKSLARSARAPLLALPGHGQVLLLGADLRRLAVLPSAEPRVDVVAFAADGTALAVGAGAAGARGQVTVHDVATGSVLATCRGERDVPLACAVDRAHGLVALGGAGKRARVLRFDGSEVFAGRHDDFVLGVAFTADGRLLAAVDRSGALRLWETATGRLGETLRGHQGAVHAVACRGNDRAATAGADGTVRLWDLTANKELWRQAAHDGEALAVAFGPGERLASCGSDGRIRVFALSGKPIARSPVAGDWLYGCAFAGSQDVVVAGDARGRLHRFDLAGKQMVASNPFELERRGN